MSAGPAHRFEALYEAHRACVERSVASLGLPRHLWPDLAQDVWLTALRRIDEFAAHPQPAAWLCTVVRNHAMHLVRGHLRRRKKLQAAGCEPRREADDPFRDRDAWDTLSRLLAACPLEQREVYLRIELHGMTAAEVAQELGVPLNTVHSRLRLGRQRLRSSAAALAATLLMLRGRPASASPFTAVLSFASISAATLVGLALTVLVVSGTPAPTPSPPSVDLATGERVGAPLERDSVHTSIRLRPWAEPPVTAGAGAIEPPSKKPAPAVARRRELASPAALPDLRPAPVDDGEALLSAAQVDYRAGRLQRALDGALRHRARFPGSELRDSREYLIAQVLCRLGRDAESRQQVRTLARDSPENKVFRKALQRLPPSCR